MSGEMVHPVGIVDIVAVEDTARQEDIIRTVGEAVRVRVRRLYAPVGIHIYIDCIITDVTRRIN